MNDTPILIKAKDCFPFENQEGNGEVIQYFISKQKELNIFQFQNSSSDDLEIAYFNNKDAKWYAGRLVGEAQFWYKNNLYKILIEPRFGNLHLFRMLEEAFNIKLSYSKNAIKKRDNYQYLIKHLIAFLWLNLLSKANKHGIPKHNEIRYNKSTKIRGRLDVRKSIIPVQVEKKVVSRYTEKIVNPTISKILIKAYKILKKEYSLGTLKTSLSAKNALEQLFTTSSDDLLVSELEYKSINYSVIYKSFKPVVDLSWDIIKKKNFNSNTDSSDESVSFFLDMAEIWEIYLRSILKKHFGKLGWNLKQDKLKVYHDKDFRRTLIPDIILEKNGKVMVWDAKYKRMNFDYFDYDRADFFQIHTYINYYNQNKLVVAGGLLYPISKEFNEYRQFKNSSNTLFNQGVKKTKYIVDGIDYSDLNDEKIKVEEINFLNRITNLQTS